MSWNKCSLKLKMNSLNAVKEIVKKFHLNFF